MCGCLLGMWIGAWRCPRLSGSAVAVTLVGMRFEVAALLFDIDGTLVDSTAAVERSWRWKGNKYLARALGEAAIGARRTRLRPPEVAVRTRA